MHHRVAILIDDVNIDEIDAEACEVLGLTGAERVAGFILIGEPGEPPRERERPQPGGLTTTWTG